MSEQTLQGKKIVLCVTGSIAAYKAVSLLRTLVENGAEVSVVMTASATQFVAPLTFEVLSGRPVLQRLFADDHPMSHLKATEDADLVLVAPATANCLAKCALGLADDLLGTLFVAARCSIVMAPAMDVEMWDHPAVAAHTRTLRERGIVVLEPEEGPLASGLLGRGRLPAEHVILDAVRARLAHRRDWSGQRVLVSAGPTREPIDAVRFITNASSGKMGYAIAEAAAQRGAEVLLVSGPTALPCPPNVTRVSVVTADEMYQELDARFAWGHCPRDDRGGRRLSAPEPIVRKGQKTPVDWRAPGTRADPGHSANVVTETDASGAGRLCRGIRGSARQRTQKTASKKPRFAGD